MDEPFHADRLHHLAHYDFEGRSEQAIREEWIYPLLELLGYGGSLDRVEFEDSLRLAQPLRKLGRQRLKVDYRPTVLRRTLWILEAKPPDESDDWETHLAQAWSYATHPEINVPIFAVADGSRIAVYDVTRADWDIPIADIAAGELADRFDELRDVLGARNVARMVRERQLSYLEQALSAELDLDVLDETAATVADIARAVEPRVMENRRLVARDQRAIDARKMAEVDRASGISGLAQEFNVPIGFSRVDLSRAIAVMEQTEPHRRKRELEEFDSAVVLRGSARRSWGVNAYALATALSVRHLAGCERPATAMARRLVRAALVGFPDDSAQKAAYRVDMALLVVAMRAVTARKGVDFAAVERHLRATREVEELLRRPIDHHHLVLQAGVLLWRLVWANIDPWDEPTLASLADALERLADGIEYDERTLRQLMLPVPLTGDGWKTADPFADYAAVFCDETDAADLLGEPERQALAEMINRSGKAGQAATRLLGRGGDT